MITLIILLVVAAILLVCLSGVCALLLDPLIAILAIYGIYKLVTLCFKKKKK